MVETCTYPSNQTVSLSDPSSTAFSVTRFRGDEDKAKSVYKGIQPLVAEDIAEDIVWAASRKEHMSVPTFASRVRVVVADFFAGGNRNVAEIFVMPVHQASPNIS
jgi:3-hydroxy acid dehydrogenase/malonic semialdehyde reductase